MKSPDLAIVGGCGHVGLPLGIALAHVGLGTLLVDIDENAVRAVNGGTLPFREDGAEGKLRNVLDMKMLEATTDASVITDVDTVVVVIGTPVDEHLNPDPQAVATVIDELSMHLRDGQLLILRSTVFPGVTQLIERLLERQGLEVDVAFCPERIAEGQAMKELFELPQIIGSRNKTGRQRSAAIFGRLTETIIYLEPEEAELAKLFTNAWRYIKFATANQFYMIANDFGLDFERIRSALAQDYPRAQDLPRAGFAAGPCLFKDTAQLAAFNKNNYTLGHSAMMVNEGLPLYVVSKLEERFDLAEMSVGILGMAFKGESDDSRSSLSYKLRRILRFKAKDVLCTDPYVPDETLVPLEDVLEHADLLIVGAPHDRYRDLEATQPIADVWGITGRGVRV